MMRSPDVELDQHFDADFHITKAVRENGRMVIRGVANGLKEDRDGERVSRRALREFIAEGVGIPLVTSVHRDDWDSKIGKVTSLAYDDSTDELIAEAELEAGDPMAEKAWSAVNKPGSRIGYSIGGKLRKAFHERTETGKRRKVLDSIRPRHLALTENPSYADSFAEAVAKTFTGDPPADSEFFEADDDIAKDASSQVQSPGGGPTGDRNAGTKSANTPSRDVNDQGSKDKPDDDDDDTDDTKDLPKARHLACPNCGHEFAADLPADLMDNDTSRDETPGRDDTNAAKSAQETPTTMPETIEDTLAKIRDLVSETDETAKTTDPDPEPEAATTDEPAAGDDVLKIVAASHRKSAEDIGELREQTAKGFESVVKAVTGLQEFVAELPLGRRSLARRGPSAPEGDTTDEGVAKSFDGEPEGESVEKRMEDADSPFAALKILNEANYNIK